MTSAATIERRLLAMVRSRAPASVCPSEVARALAPESWRPLMQPVREVAFALAAKGRLRVTQGGHDVSPPVRGPIRLAQGYRIGRGEEGVLTVEPYKSQLLPLWKFATPTLARRSAKALWKEFMCYGRAGDFVGMDMARKFLQMGMTRATRYARHPGGRKYAPGTRDELPRVHDAEKAEAAAIFRATWERALKNPTYRRLKREFMGR